MGFDHWMCGYTTDTCWSINDKWLVPALKSNAWIGDYHHVGTGNSRSSPTSICSGMTGLVCEDRLATGSFGLESQVLTLYWMLFLVVHRFSENTPGLESHYRSRHVINKRLKKSSESASDITCELRGSFHRRVLVPSSMVSRNQNQQRSPHRQTDAFFSMASLLPKSLKKTEKYKQYTLFESLSSAPKSPVHGIEWLTILVSTSRPSAMPRSSFHVALVASALNLGCHGPPGEDGIYSYLLISIDSVCIRIISYRATI